MVPVKGRQMKRLSPFVVAAMLLLNASAYGKDASARAITKDELIGTWEYVAPPTGSAYPYQLLVFQQDGTMRRMQSTKPFNDLSMTLMKSAPATVVYTVNDKGILKMTWTDMGHTEEALATYLTKDMSAGKGPKKGDLILTYYDARGEIAQADLFRKK
jgi:hypothetical protein